MVDQIRKVPDPVSIQTGATRVQNLVPIHEGKDYNVPVTFKDPPPKETFNDEPFPDEALQPPPYIEETYGGNFGEFMNTQGTDGGGTRFDPNSSMDSMKQKSPYHIIDLFWFINPNLSNRQQFMNEESHFCQVSYNIDFGNMKITLFKIPNGALQGHVIFLMSLLRLTSGTIYPSSLFKLINESENNKKDETSVFTCLEQLVVKTGEPWQSNRPVCSFEVNSDIILTITDRNGAFFYKFSDWQKKALIHAAKFATNEGYVLTGNLNIK
jgi:hypothetical protein